MLKNNLTQYELEQIRDEIEAIDYALPIVADCKETTMRHLDRLDYLIAILEASEQYQDSNYIFLTVIPGGKE